MKHNKFGIIDWSQMQLLKWDLNIQAAHMDLKFKAPTIGGGWPEHYSKRSEIEIYRPHGNFLYAMSLLKPLVCRAMDWRQDDKVFNRIKIIGLEQKFEDGIVTEIYISFNYRSNGTGVRTDYKKGACFHGYTGLSSSLSEGEQEDLAKLINEIGLYFARRKGESAGLFSNDYDEGEPFDTTKAKLGNN